MKACHRCRTPWEEPVQPGFNNTCPRCGMPLHACANCLHFVSRGPLRCLVSKADPVMDPMSGNRCRYFEFTSPDLPEPARREPAPVRASEREDQQSARKRFYELFGEQA